MIKAGSTGHYCMSQKSCLQGTQGPHLHMLWKLNDIFELSQSLVYVNLTAQCNNVQCYVFHVWVWVVMQKIFSSSEVKQHAFWTSAHYFVYSVCKEWSIRCETLLIHSFIYIPPSFSSVFTICQTRFHKNGKSAVDNMSTARLLCTICSTFTLIMCCFK